MDVSHAEPARAGQGYAWLFTDRSMMVRILERPTAGGQVEVTSDGPAPLCGRHLFATGREAAEFRLMLQRQLVAAGFTVLGHSAVTS
jgi:hypothetical protein